MNTSASRRSGTNEAARAVRIAALVVALLVAISLLDQVTGLFHFTVLYAVPIMIAAWAFGLFGGLFAGAVALAVVAATHSLRHSPTLVADIATDVVVFVFAAVVIDRLRRELKTIRMLEARRDFDLRIARGIQQHLLSSPPADSRFNVACTLHSAFELGGDYYRFDHVEGHLFFCVGDIAGKGVAAALFAALLDESLTEALSGFVSLEETVAALNKRMHDSMPSDMFVTMFLALLGDDSMSFVNAGHVRPLLFQKTTKRVIELSEAGTLPLGVDPDSDSNPVSRPLGEGDVLLVFSDGVTESPAIIGSPELLVRAFQESVGLGPQGVVDRVTALAEVGGQKDDVTVVCVQRK